MSKAKVEIIYQDEGIIVINKPAGVSVTKDRSGKEQLTDILAGQIDKQVCSQLRLIHRLDKDTSGVMILAKNVEAQRKFSNYFENKIIKLDDDFERLFKANKNAWNFFVKQAPSYQKTRSHWIISAKKETTKISRLNKLIMVSEKQNKLF